MKAARYVLSLFALLCFVEALLPDAAAQQTEELRKEFQGVKSKAEQGDALAQSGLGWMYDNGQGVEKDYAEAYAWYNIAAKTEPKAAEMRDDLEKKMSPQQVGEAQKRTRELKALLDAKKKNP